ncbi:dienelactone hydrolase family protein [Allopontixanthobacter sediminis]|uniref:Dienelactone hydrolase family protein n=1 Tax=Allopontixanthobacter sediminis TaxID=1689985 RepID=A0A845B5P4_9SPHN|nr:dienelactone hydrolase family protein [Allopontixanthobacter sediminis]MXP44832.1 dienelactone hydrolase family protein [Allopontixanthobacter sediminis]
MCDRTTPAEYDTTNADWREAAMAGFSRRQFGAIGAAGAAATLAACAGVDRATASEGGLTESNVTIQTPDGMMDAFFVRPASGKHPAVICWPDIASLRDAFMMMARRTAAEGYSVLVANPYYRDTKAPQFADFAEFRTDGGWDKVGPWRAKLTAETITRDAKALIGWLDAQDSVDTARGIGTEGYCMGGPFTVWTAAAVPTRVGAAASFHGGGLVGDSPTSPINLLDVTRASHLIAIAQNDDAKAPDEKTKLRAAAEATGTPAQIEVYAGDHGWTVIDSPAYAKEAAEKAYADKMALYSKL